MWHIISAASSFGGLLERSWFKAALYKTCWWLTLLWDVSQPSYVTQCTGGTVNKLDCILLGLYCLSARHTVASDMTGRGDLRWKVTSQMRSHSELRRIAQSLLLLRRQDFPRCAILVFLFTLYLWAKNTSIFTAGCMFGEITASTRPGSPAVNKIHCWR